MFKRIGLLLISNVLIMITITTVLNVLGIGHYLTAQGINYTSLAVFCLVWGFAGALISLLLSKTMAKMMMGVKIISDSPSMSSDAQWLVQTTYRLADAAGLPKRPEIGIYESDDINAFATGPSRSNALVAVSTGLLNKMDRTEAEGVLAHEVAHIANGDMLTMTMLQGLVNAFGMFISRILANVLSSFVDEEKAPIVQMVATIVFDILFSILGMFVVAYYSRQREFRADAGGAQLGGRQKMIAALEKLNLEYQYMTRMGPQQAATPQNNGIQSLQISSRRSGLLALLSTHPPLEVRIEKLKKLAS